MSKTLLIFEGEVTEPRYFEAIKKHFPFKGELLAIFGTTIYQLYDKLNNDDGLDLLGILKERKLKNNINLNEIRRRDISEVYLFFDHDSHDCTATPDKLAEMLELFNDETDNGKLYISYPMVESLLSKTGEVTVKLADVKIFKLQIQREVPTYLKSLNKGKLNRNQLKGIFLDHLRKTNWIVNGSFTLKDSAFFEQAQIYNYQLTKFVEPKKEVAVLSAFPLFVDDYFKREFLFYRD